MTIDLKDFYLNTPMKQPEYMRLKMTDIPVEIIKQYKLREIATPDVYVYVRPRIRKFPVPKLALPILVRVPVLVRADPHSSTGIAF